MTSQIEEIKQYTINNLDFYSLLHIFEFIPLADRFRNQRVCKLWQQVAQNSRNSIKKIKLSSGSHLGLLKGSIYKNEIRFSADWLEIILPKCRNVEEIDVCGCYSVTDEYDPLMKVAEYCPNIRKVVAALNNTTGVTNIADLCKKIDYFEFNCDFEISYNIIKFHKALKYLLLNAKQLKTLKLKNMILSPIFYALKSDSLENVIVDSCLAARGNDIFDIYLSIVNNFESLKETTLILDALTMSLITDYYEYWRLV